MIIDESEIYGRHYVKIVIYPEKTLSIYYDHWWRNIMDRATVIEWAVNFRQKFCNALAVEHKCSDSWHIDWALNYNRESTRIPRYDHFYTPILYRNHSPVCFSLKSFSLTNLSIGAIWLMPHRRVTLPPSSFCRFSIYKDNPIHNIVHPLRQGAQLFIFCIISLAPSVGTLIIQAIFPNDKRVPRSTRWK